MSELGRYKTWAALRERTALERGHGDAKRDARESGLSRRISPFLIDLKPKPETATQEQARQERRRLPMRWQMLLNERIHLREMSYRSVSIKPRGWRDLPPDEARTLAHAVSVTARKFFLEHPLADLTVIAVARTFFAVVWMMTLEPLASALPKREREEALPVPAVLPFMPVAATTEDAVAMQPENHAEPDARTELFRALPFRPLLRFRGAFAFAAVTLAIVLPIGGYASYRSVNATKNAAFGMSASAVGHLREAAGKAMSNDFEGATTSFELASEDLQSLKKRLGVFSGVLTAAGSVAPSTSVSAAGLMLTAGEGLAEGGRILTSGVGQIDSDAPPAERIRGINSQLARALPHLERASEAVALISPNAIPQEYRDDMDTAKNQLPKMVSSVREATRVTGFLALVLGADEPKRYLVVFQNNSELRATGGFVGSFALLDVSRGEIKNLEMPGGGSYDLQGSLSTRIISPRPLHLINPHWQFQDANWSPDYPTSARKLAWFYEKSGGPTVDGVIAVNATVMERLLEVLGPVEMTDYDVTLDAENFMEETQREVETDYDRTENRPKQILADLAPILIDRVMDAERSDYVRMAEALRGSLSSKDIQLWFNDAEMQNRASEFGWTGEMSSPAGDYLEVVHSNVAGQKTDIKMEESVRHDVKVLADGSAVVTLVISRTHQGIKGEPFTGVRNVDYLRVYVPLGSTLVEASGFEIPDPKLFKLADAGYAEDPDIAQTEAGETLDRQSGTRTYVESGKTVFGNWVQTDPGETSVLTLVYRLPDGTVKIEEPQYGGIASLYADLTNGAQGRRVTYSLLVQKQSGARPSSFVSSVDLPRGYSVIWETPQHETDERGRETASVILNADAFFGIVAEGVD